jgi:hypothetical protein
MQRQLLQAPQSTPVTKLSSAKDSLSQILHGFLDFPPVNLAPKKNKKLTV